MKKLLSILLTVMMLASVFMVPANAFVPEREILFLPENVFLSQDYSDPGKTDFTHSYSDAAFGTPVIDSGAISLDTSAYNSAVGVDRQRSAFVSDATIGDATTITVQFDVSLDQDVPVFTEEGKAYTICFGSGNAYKSDSPWLIEFYPSGLPKNTVVTYRFTLDLAADTSDNIKYLCTSAYEKRGDGEFKELAYDVLSYPYLTAGSGKNIYRCYKDNYSGTANYVTQMFSVGGSNNFTLGSTALIYYDGSAKSCFTTAPVVTFDNIKIYKEAGKSVAGSYTKKTGVHYSNDFEESDSFLASAVDKLAITQKTDSAGNGYWELAATDSSAPNDMSSATTTAFGPNKTITVDLQCVTKGTPFLISAMCPSAQKNDNNDYMGINIFDVPDGNWYTYKIEVGSFDSSMSLINDHEQIIDIYRKPVGAADSAYVELTGINLDPLPGGLALDNTMLEGMDYGWGASTHRSNDFLVFGYSHGRFYASDALKLATKWNIDNLQIRDNVAFTGEYTATNANLFVESNENNEVVIMASYEDKVLKDVKFKELDGSDNKVDLSVTAGDNTKIFIWNSLVDGKPILVNPIEI